MRCQPPARGICRKGPIESVGQMRHDPLFILLYVLAILVLAFVIIELAGAFAH